MREFIAALRELRCPIVAIAVAVLVLQTLVAGLATAHAGSRLASNLDALVLCHGNGGDDGTAPASRTAHDCCKFCTAAGPAALAPSTIVLDRLGLVPHGEALAPVGELHRVPRAVRAGPSQAPPHFS